MRLSLACGAVCGAVAFSLAPHIPALPEISTSEGEAEVRLSPVALRAASGGYEAVASDWYWLGAIQYFGTRSNVEEHFRRLAGYLDLATDLDPDFGYAYIFGGYAIPERNQGEKQWHNIDAAIKLLQKGMASNSTRWEIPYLLAYMLFTYRGDYLEAAQLMREASKRPKAPAYLLSFVGTLTAQGHGNMQAAIDFTRGALENAPDHWTRDDLQDRLRGLELQQALDRLNSAAQLRRAEGQPLSSLQDLIGYGEIKQIPEEPYGGSFHLENGRVVSSDDDKMLHVFIHPRDPPTQPYVD
jgi:hypothetical protein